MYGKFFKRCFTGSMVGAGAHVFAVWAYAISNAVKSRVELNPEYLHRIIGASVEEMQKAIDYLASPDPRSTHEENDGRRIVKEGAYQYFIPQFDRYQQIRNNDDLREQNRIRQARHREKIKQLKRGKPLPGEQTFVKISEEKGQAEADLWQEKQEDARVAKKSELEKQAAIIYFAYPKRVGKPKAIQAIVKAIAIHGFDYIESKTREYAMARQGEDPQFTPYPAKWFNQQQYEDDPSTWKSNEKHQQNNRERVDRNKGTLNEGRASAYATKPKPPAA